jgi:hypothetical protein
VKISIATHHWVNAAVLENRRKDGLPILCQGKVFGEDITNRYDIPQLLLDSIANFPPGLEDTWLIAASASSKALGLIGIRDVCGHATGPLGFPGGYPITIRKGVVALDLPATFSLEECIAVNEAGAALDGIREITDSGKVILTDKASQIMYDMLGWETTSFVPADTPKLGMELVECHKEFAENVGSAAR